MRAVVVSSARRADRINAFVQRWTDDETAKFVRESGNIGIALPGGDFLEHSLDMPGRENDQHSKRLVRKIAPGVRNTPADSDCGAGPGVQYCVAVGHVQRAFQTDEMLILVYEYALARRCGILRPTQAP
jgi:hypothetical protein